MGAGSKRVSPQERAAYYKETHPNLAHKDCKFHFPREQSRHRFLNTGKPYAILYCYECKQFSLRVL